MMLFARIEPGLALLTVLLVHIADVLASANIQGAPGDNDATVRLARTLQQHRNALTSARTKYLTDQRAAGIVSNAGRITGKVDAVLDTIHANTQDYWLQLEQNQLDDEWSLTRTLVLIDEALTAQLGTALRRSLVHDVLREFRAAFDRFRQRQADELREKRQQFWRLTTLSAADVHRLAQVAQTGRCARGATAIRATAAAVRKAVARHSGGVLEWG